MHWKKKSCILNGFTFRSSHRRCSAKKGILKNFTKFTGKHLCWSLFLIKFHPWKFIKKRLQHRCFPVKFAKILSAIFFYKNLWWLLLIWDRYTLSSFRNLQFRLDDLVLCKIWMGMGWTRFHVADYGMEWGNARCWRLYWNNWVMTYVLNLYCKL